MRANSQQVGFCFRHTAITAIFCNISCVEILQILPYLNKNVCIRGNQGLIEMLTPEADWGCRLPRLPGLPGLPRLLLAFFLFPQFLSLSPQKHPFYLRFPLKVLFFHEFSLYYTAILTIKYNINSKNQYVKKVLI